MIKEKIHLESKYSNISCIHHCGGGMVFELFEPVKTFMEKGYVFPAFLGYLIKIVDLSYG